MKFLNITTTGVKIQQAQQPNEISEYHNYWSKNTTSTASNLMKFLNITTTGVKIQQTQQPQQPNEISEYHNYWSKNTTSTASTGT